MEIQGKVRDILHAKGGRVYSTTPQATVYEAIGLMGDNNIGALIVIEDGCVAGVISERDYSRKVVLRGRTSRDTRVGEILSRPAVTVTGSTGIAECMRIMTEHRIRHLPVVNDQMQPEGVVSMGDLVNWVITTQEQTIQQLHGYIAGEYPG